MNIDYIIISFNKDHRIQSLHHASDYDSAERIAYRITYDEDMKHISYADIYRIENGKIIDEYPMNTVYSAF